MDVLWTLQECSMGPGGMLHGCFRMSHAVCMLDGCHVDAAWMLQGCCVDAACKLHRCPVDGAWMVHGCCVDAAWMDACMDAAGCSMDVVCTL